MSLVPSRTLIVALVSSLALAAVHAADPVPAVSDARVLPIDIRAPKVRIGLTTPHDRVRIGSRFAACGERARAHNGPEPTCHDLPPSMALS